MVAREQRHTKANRCPVCGGADEDPRGRGKRCSGFSSEDGSYVHCSREDFAGNVSADEDNLYVHFMHGECKCGNTHGPITSTQSTVERTYDYRDENRNVLFQVVRRKGPNKFRQRRPDGSGGWIWNLQNVRRVLYRLPELIEADKECAVYIVEGEKDTETLIARGYVATTGPMGAESSGRKAWKDSVGAIASTVLAGRDVTIVSDADDVGRKHARLIESFIAGTVRSLKLLEPPAPHKDVTELLEAGGTLDQLVQISEIAQKPDQKTKDIQPGTESKKPEPWEVPPPTPEPPRIRVAPDQNSWRERLLKQSVKDKKTHQWVDVILSNPSNAIKILRNHPQWRGVLAWDAFGERILKLRTPPWIEEAAPQAIELGPLEEEDVCRIIDWFACEERMAMSALDIRMSVPVVAKANAFHPVREYLKSIKWDGTERLPTWLAVYCGTQPTSYHGAIGTRWMISAVARVAEPGCQVDCMLILEGKQGTGKSSAFRALVPHPSMFSETGVNLGDKDSYQCLHGVWLYLLDELDSVKRGETTRVKNFITSPKDRYRPSYGHIARDFYRQNIFCGTTDGDEYLVDRAGNRRFWPARVVRAIDVRAITRDRDQLWAEALVRYERGEPWHVDTPSLRSLCEGEQAERMQSDGWDEIVAEWLLEPRVRLDVDKLRATGGPVMISKDVFLTPEGPVLTEEILVHGLGKRVSEISRADTMRVAEILRTLGYERGKQARENGSVVRRYRKSLGSDDVMTDRDDTSNLLKRVPKYLLSLPSPPSSHVYIPGAFIRDGNGVVENGVQKVFESSTPVFGSDGGDEPKKNGASARNHVTEWVAAVERARHQGNGAGDAGRGEVASAPPVMRAGAGDDERKG